MTVNQRADKFVASRFLRSSQLRLEDVGDTGINNGAKPGVEAGQISQDGCRLVLKDRIRAGGNKSVSPPDIARNTPFATVH